MDKHKKESGINFDDGFKEELRRIAITIVINEVYNCAIDDAAHMAKRFACQNFQIEKILSLKK